MGEKIKPVSGMVDDEPHRALRLRIKVGQRCADIELVDDATHYGFQIGKGGIGTRQRVDEQVTYIIDAIGVVGLDLEIVVDGPVCSRREAQAGRQNIARDGHVLRTGGEMNGRDQRSTRTSIIQQRVVADRETRCFTDSDAMGVSIVDDVVLYKNILIIHLGPGEACVDQSIAHEY